MTCNVNTGMTLRDYFAAAALQGLLASGQYPNGLTTIAVKRAWKEADAMLAARTTPTGGQG